MKVKLAFRRKANFSSPFFHLISGNVLPESTRTSIKEQCIGEYSGVTRTLYLERCGEVYWVGERPPKDRTIKRIVPDRVNITIYVALCITASLGIILAISFLGVNIKFRHQKYVKYIFAHF